MPITRAHSRKLEQGKIESDCGSLRIEISEERRKRIAAESQTKLISLECERKLEIVHRELELEKLWRINAQENLSSLLLRIPQNAEEKESPTNVHLEENVAIDGSDEGILQQLKNVSLDSRSKIEILGRELEIERSWRSTCQENLNSLIKRLPLQYREKGPNNELQFSSLSNNNIDNTKHLAQMDEANKEIERLKHECSTLLQKFQTLQSAHESELAVYEGFRHWFEQESFCQTMRFKEMKPEDIENLLKDKQKIGFGGFGSVYKAALGDKLVAIKMLDENGLQGSREYHTEVEILRKIHHPNIVHLIGACLEKKALVYEYLENGTLAAVLKNQGAGWFTWKQRINVALSIYSALIFLHSVRPTPVGHGDLKPDNIMFGPLNVAKLCDFGISHELASPSTTHTGTWEHKTQGVPRGSASYVDPEFIETCKLTPFADVYAFGVILLQLVTGQDATGLVNLVQTKLSALPGLKSKGKRMQREVLEKSALIDRNLLTYDPLAALLILQLGLDCTRRNSRERPSLSASVWPKMNMMKLQYESSATA